MDANITNALSEFVKSLRDGYSQRAFAPKIGVSYTALRAWENAESFPNLDSLELLCKIKGWSLLYTLAYLGYDCSSDVLIKLIDFLSYQEKINFVYKLFKILPTNIKMDILKILLDSDNK
jgi:transcriptional regulator with XRE-family HTH domain